jgi:hypothetical protein
MAAKKKIVDAAASDMHCRIKPSNQRESHHVAEIGLTIRKIDGWVVVSADQARVLREEPMSELNPEASPKVFDVVTAEEAAELEEMAQVRTDPAGTATNPKKAVRR